MTYAIKRNTRCQAWELGSGSEIERSMIFHPENPDRYFSASLWETEESAACDAVIVFFDVKRGAEGKIERINFNFVDAEYFQNNYSLMSEEK
ncbi:MAG: hypothetical protein K5678_06695 [Acetatifactor sp.]|nr:hypothetical protein [Acetatifactor sp.]